MRNLLRVYFNRRMAALLGLGFASGLPALLIGDNLQLWLQSAGVSRQQIGLFSLTALPLAFKFLWAPLMDRFAPPWLGRRRGWLILTQIALAAAIGWITALHPAAHLGLLAAGAFVIALLSASQDIVADAYRVDVLPAEERGAGTAVWVMGYRLALIALGAGALVLVGRYRVSWPSVYIASAALMAACIFFTLLAPEPANPGERPPSLRDAVLHPLADLLLRPGGLIVLAFIVLFRLPDAFAKAMSLLFLREIGLPEATIGAVRQGLGLGMTIVGALAGGLLVARLGVRRSLWVFGFLQALSNLGFWVLTRTGPAYSTFVGVIVVENFCAGLVTAGFVAFLMGQCDARYSAFQYALLSSVMRLTDIAAAAPSGFLATRLGWGGFFLFSIVTAVPGMALLPLLRGHGDSDLTQRRQGTK